MFSKILVPVDLAHSEQLTKALACAQGLAKQHDADLTYIGVTSPSPSAVAHSPAEYSAKLADFAESHGAESRVYESHDPAADLDQILLRAIGELGADLVVMASHIPGAPEHFFASNAGAVASHAKISVFVVR